MFFDFPFFGIGKKTDLLQVTTVTAEFSQFAGILNAVL